jgi:16S rRNA pseudouridine516 synthase
MQIRLDKFLADSGEGTRSAVKQMMKQGRVRVNGSTAVRPEMKVNTETDEICVDGRNLTYHAFEYFMLNKPAGVISASEDKTQKTVLDLIAGQKRRDLFPVGRLDKDTEGLLLITNDGPLCNRLLAPGKHVDKKYYALVRGQVTKQDVEQFRRGVLIGDEKPTREAWLTILETGVRRDDCFELAELPTVEGQREKRESGEAAERAVAEQEAAEQAVAEQEAIERAERVEQHAEAEEIYSRIRLVITEGRYHQVKRMFQAVGKEVVYLKRLSMGPLELDEALEPGQYRKLTEEELKLLQP